MNNEDMCLLPEFRMTMDGRTLMDIKKCVVSLKSHDTYISVSEDRINIRGLDDAHMVMVDIDIPGSKIPYYNAIHTGFFDFDFSRIPALHEGNVDIYQITREHYGEQRMLCFRQGYLTQSRGIGVTYGKPYRLPEYGGHTVVFIMPVKRLLNIIKSIKTVSDKVNFRSEDDRITVSGGEDDPDSSDLIDSHGGVTIARNPDVTGAIESIYYIDDIVKAMKSASNKAQVVFSFAGDKPARIQYKISNNILAIYYIAKAINE